MASSMGGSMGGHTQHFPKLPHWLARQISAAPLAPAERAKDTSAASSPAIDFSDISAAIGHSLFSRGGGIGGVGIGADLAAEGKQASFAGYGLFPGGYRRSHGFPRPELLLQNLQKNHRHDPGKIPGQVKLSRNTTHLSFCNTACLFLQKAFREVFAEGFWFVFLRGVSPSRSRR